MRINILPFFLICLRSSYASVISSSDSRLPMSLSSVISDLEAEGCDDILAACVVTSRTATDEERQALYNKLSSSTENNLSKVVGLENGLALAQPTDDGTVAETAVACGGNVVYYPTLTDLSRGEGLFDHLAPVMESLAGLSEPSRLIVVYPDGTDAATVKSQLESAAAVVSKNLIVKKPVKSLSDVFQVQYVSMSEAASSLQGNPKASPESLRAKIAAMATESLFTGSTPACVSTLAPEDLAAARQLGPRARKILEDTAARVENAVSGGTLVPDFGAFCQAATNEALSQLQEDSAPKKSRLGPQIAANLKDALSSQWDGMADDQLSLLETECFANYKQALSKLMVGPNLPTDMSKVVEESIREFGRGAGRVAGAAASAAKVAYARRLQQHSQNRLLNARAGGQYKPIPRKGVTVGLHWLLPKPFGNDFRQEPWMTHATEGMTYVAPDKISDVSPEEVRRGDWREQIVPSPVGNDLLYLQ